MRGTISKYNKQSNPERPEEIIYAAQALVFKAVREGQRPLVRLLYKMGVSQGTIGKELGVTRQAVSLQFPKEDK